MSKTITFDLEEFKKFLTLFTETDWDNSCSRSKWEWIREHYLVNDRGTIYCMRDGVRYRPEPPIYLGTIEVVDEVWEEYIKGEIKDG